MNEKTRHKWSKPDEYGIAECTHCKCLMRKRVNSHYELRAKRGIRWIVLYSTNGAKWTADHLPCVTAS